MNVSKSPSPQPDQELQRKCVRVRGVVQGVGFRPFVYRLATEEHLAGLIGNDTDGVTIELEGPLPRLESFLTRLTSETPSLARIDSVDTTDLALTGESGFRIVASEVLGRVSTGIPADAATCPDCLRELLDPADRRYRYPFLNCTNCGPRFTITRRIPYDRPQTSMAVFPMCLECQAEYDDPLNRRFHAQPNACWRCGPHVWMVDATGTETVRLDTAKSPRSQEAPRHVIHASKRNSARSQEASGYDFSRAEPVREQAGALQAAEKLNPERLCNNGTASAGPKVLQDESRASAPAGFDPQLSPSIRDFSAACLAPERDAAVAETITRLLRGDILAIKGIGGFHLAVDATNDAAVTRLRQRKHRYGKPLAIMVRDLDAARALCNLTAEEESLLQTPARPIVLAHARPGNDIAPSVAPGIPWLGIFLPYAPLQHLLFADPRVKALIMTSANLSEEPIAIDNAEARTRLSNIADAFLMHNREILQRCDDSVSAIVEGGPQIIRRARGYVPLALPLPLDSPPLLAVGGHLKNVFALARGKFVYQSQHLGDLENVTGLEFFEHSLRHLMHTFEIEPQTVVHDLHPGYLSTGWAKQWAADRGPGLRLIAVQHHHAHIAGCMAEHALDGPVIGLSLDGTGYGTDGHIWGGEVLICSLSTFERFAHLDYVPMPGGEAAIREPWRMAFGHLRAAGIDTSVPAIPNLLGATEQETRVLSRMIERRLNTPLTSSCGRLFDALAAVVLNRREVDYDAQAAIELEGCAVEEPYTHDIPAPYRLELFGGDWANRHPIRIKPANLWRGILDDLKCGVAKPVISARFHAAVARAFVEAAMRARSETGIVQVALSGGCMHNRRLVRLLRSGLEAEGFKVLLHRHVSPGDGGLSYGQAAVAAAILLEETPR